MENNFSNVMDFVHELNKTHGVKQRGGKMYTQVVHRMEALRRFYGTEYGVDTQILVDDGQRVVVKATITNLDGIVVGSGMAEEIRGQGYFELGDKRNINTTSALENCETSAVGRALASIGLAGGEYASANEIDGVGRKREAQAEAENKPVVDPENPVPAKRDDDPEVRKTQDFFGEVNKKVGEVNNKSNFIAWCNTDHVKNGIAHMKQHNPDLAKMAVDRIQLRMKQLKGEA